MPESIAFSKTNDRSVIYSEITPQIEALIADEPDLTANLANIAAVLKEAFGFFWVGFYLRRGDQLVLGPFQGPLACTRIDFGHGVCGYAYTTASTVIVPNVDEFPGHIACSSDSKSEIVVPIAGDGGEVIGVLDVDSDKLDDFSETDRIGLTGVVGVLERVIRSHTNSGKIE
jgi:GAF domain-containing protein